MSYIFDVNNQTVWSPSSRVGRLFVEMAKSFATIVSHGNGISAMAEDFYDVDGDVFLRFVQALLSDPLAEHPVYAEMARGFIATSVVMLERSGRVVVIPNEWMSSIEASAKISGAMPDL